MVWVGALWLKLFSSEMVLMHFPLDQWTLFRHWNCKQLAGHLNFSSTCLKILLESLFKQCARSKFDQGVKTTTESPSQVSNTGWNLQVVESFRYCHSGTLQSLGYQKRQVGSCCKEEASRKNERWHLIQIQSSWASYSNPRWNKE